jgi:hypothetical protein
MTETSDDGLLVVAAPAIDSEPTTPLSDHAPYYIPPWIEDAEDAEESQSLPTVQDQEPPRLPKRRPPHRVLSTSEEDGHKLPSWMAAQEELTRSKVDGVDEDMGV